MKSETNPAYKADILVVDDKHDNLRLLSKLLTGHGYYVRPVSKGKRAVSAIQNQPPDLILLDIMMPDMDGYEVCQKLKSDERTRNIPVIFVTGLDQLADKIRAFSIGGIDYITKPFQEEEILARVHTHLELKKARESLRTANIMLNAVFRSIPDTIITVDEKLRVINSNTGSENICRISKNEKTSCFQKRVNSDMGPCRSVLLKTLETRRPVKEFHTNCSYEGGKRELVLNTTPLTEPENPFTGVVLVIRDITRLTELEKKIIERHSFQNIIGKSKKMQEIYSLLKQIADLDINVLITGESGTGKELIADALHHESSRASGQLVKVNCAALPENLLESELFGHVRGAFTGSVKDRAGRIRIAEGGTIFLDEIGDISTRLQAKLLRLIENKEYERLGSSKTLKADIRVVAATNCDLKESVQQGTFREDLYQRLKSWVIHLPPLKKRATDIPLLTKYFLNLSIESADKHIDGVSDEVMRLFLDYPWPGNIRELKYTVEHACILCPGGRISVKHLPIELMEYREKQGDKDDSKFAYSPKISREILLDALKKNNWNKAKAADSLCIGRSTLYRYMTRYEIGIDS